MKKLVFLLAIVSTMFMVSCEKDDIVPDNTSNPTDTTTNVVDLVCEVTHTDVTSFGGDDGTITVTVKSGNPPYEFILDGVTKDTSSNTIFTFTNLTAGDYDVSVKDSEDKTFDETVTVNEADETFADLVISVEVTHNEFDNNSGVIEVTVTGGREPYSFFLNGVEWNDNVFTNLGGGKYTVTVKDANSDEVSEVVDVMFGFDIDVNVVHSNTHTDDGGVVTILPNVTNAGNSPYTFSIDGIDWVNNNVFDNISVPVDGMVELTVYAKDKFETVRGKVVVVENNYDGYRVGDEYNKDGYVGVVFEVLGNDVRIADTQNFGVDMDFGSYLSAYFHQINTGGLNWETMDIETLTTYLNVAKDYVDSGNIFNVEVSGTSSSTRRRYWSNISPPWSNNQKLVRSIQINNDGYYVDNNNDNTNNSESNFVSTNMRGRYVTTRPNNKN
ncbi:MAG: SprB repeat-containing protein [Bacteroidales bacterium]